VQAYGKAFARVYNARWTNFAKRAAPFIMDFYAASPAGRERGPVLDLCCGTGQLAACFLERGFKVTGLDKSEHMLRHARENCRSYIDSGQASFVQADACDFTLGERFGLVVSTFDAINHLEDETALRKCFECVSRVCGGLFIFDLNTRSGLGRWNSINVDESENDALIITRGIYDGQSDKAWVRITGFAEERDGLYSRFEETVFNTVFGLGKVRKILLETGWAAAHFAALESLGSPLEAPESGPRVFVTASKI
jgi:SAM-dependent methyltransferase